MYQHKSRSVLNFPDSLLNFHYFLSIIELPVGQVILRIIRYKPKTQRIPVISFVSYTELPLVDILRVRSRSIIWICAITAVEGRLDMNYTKR